MKVEEKLRLKKVIERNNWPERDIMEDKLLNNSNVQEIIEELHGEILKIFRHFFIYDMEVDAILFCKKTRDIRRIGIELKEMDLVKAVSQAILRRNYFNYFYIILRTNAKYIGYRFRGLYKFNLLKDFFDRKIGLIVVDWSDNAFLLFPSHFNKFAKKIEIDTKVSEFV
jgi:hypothetical protein